MPAGDPWHDNVEVPEPPGIVADDRVHTRLVELVFTTRLTVPVKPLIGNIVMVEGLATPTFTVALVGVAVTVKSGAGATW